MAFKNLFKANKDKKVESSKVEPSKVEPSKVEPSKVEPSKVELPKSDEITLPQTGEVAPTKDQIAKHERAMEKIKTKGGLSDFRKQLHDKQKLAREAKQPIYPKV